MKVAVFGKRRQSPEDVPHILALLRTLEEENAFISIDRHFFEAMSRLAGEPLPADDVFDNDEFSADFCLSIGGDGTFLRTARRVAAKEIPILGFNTGPLGLLAEHSIANGPRLIRDIAEGNYTVEPRSLLEGKGIGEGVKAGVSGWGFALNEIAIVPQRTSTVCPWPPTRATD